MADSKFVYQEKIIEEIRNNLEKADAENDRLRAEVEAMRAELEWIVKDSEANHARNPEHCDDCSCSYCHALADSYARAAKRAIEKVKP